MEKVIFQQVTWESVAKRVRTVNPELHKIICDLSPDDSYRLYTGEYPFGCEFVKEGRFQLPTKGDELRPLTDPNIPKQIQEDLSYNEGTNPACLLLKNSIEIYMLSSLFHVIGWTIPEGGILGISRVLAENPQHPPFLWNISSGARSLIMLPKISRARNHQRLRSELGINIEKPDSIFKHWEVFKSIANCGKFKPWSSKILFFSKKWFERLKDPAFQSFRCYLLENNRKRFDYIGNMYIWEMVFSLILKNRDIRPSLYTNNCAKYLFQLAMGMTPGLAPAVNNVSAPIKMLQKAYIDIYGLKDYVPTIMQPNYFNPYEPCDSIYHSLQTPTFFDTPKKRDNSSLISDLYDIYALFNKYISYIRTMKLNIEGSALHQSALNTQVDALHPSPERYTPIKSSKTILANDKRFSQCLYPTKYNEVAINSTLLKGCFRFCYYENKK
ncbi:MAG: hypothetical protein ACE365_01680 [Gammaproteobacteria bacterium]